MGEIKIQDYLKAIPDIPRSQWGKTFMVACPCGGQLMVARVPINGHLRAACSKCGFNLTQ